MKTTTELFSGMHRRQWLQAVGGAGALIAGGAAIPMRSIAQTSFACVMNPEMTEGPYWVEEKLNRSDIRIDPSDGTVRPGIPLTIAINVYLVSGNGCALLPGAVVDIWHCDAGGIYSDVAANSTVGRRFLRGYQVSNASGQANFTTIYPGWYRGRAVHIHLRIRTYNGTALLGTFTSQMFFDDAVTDAVFAAAPYNTRGTRDTRNANDGIYTGAGSSSSRTLLTLTKTAEGHAASINVGVNLPAGSVTTTPYALSQLAYGGGWATQLYLANTTESATSAQVSFFDRSGAALTVPLAGAGAVSSQSLDLPARAVANLEASNTGSLQEGWAEVAMPSGVIGYAVLRQTAAGRADQEAVVPFSPETSQRATLIFDETAYSTGLALSNPSAQQVNVAVAAFSAAGASLGTATIQLAARGSVAASLRELSGLSGIAGSRGWLAISTTGSAISVLGLRFAGEAFTTILPAYS